MGAKYAIAANRVLPGKLHQTPRRVLVTMALRVMDKGNDDIEAGVYAWGYERILGDIALMPTKSSLRHLKECIALLIELGLLEQTRAPAPGQRAAWRLCLPVDNHHRKGPRKGPRGP
jgi:hypothetical protein